MEAIKMQGVREVPGTSLNWALLRYVRGERRIFKYLQTLKWDKRREEKKCHLKGQVIIQIISSFV